MCAPHWNRIKTCLLYTQNHTLLYKYRTTNMARSKYATLRSGRDLHYPFHWFYETSQFSILMDFRTFIFDTLPNAWIFVQEWWKNDTEKWQFSWGDSSLKKGEKIVAEITQKPETFRKFRARSFKVSSMVPVVDIVEHLWRGALDHFGGFGMVFSTKIASLPAYKLRPCCWSHVWKALIRDGGERPVSFFWRQRSDPKKLPKRKLHGKLHERGTACIASIGSFP